MKRSRLAKSRSRRLGLGCERLEVRRVLDASAVPIWDQMPDVAGQALTLDAGMTATTNAQSGDWTFTASSSVVMITGYTGAGGEVEIPSQIGGLPVRTIGTSAFSGKTSLTTVTIPASVTSIGGSAFSNCTSLTSVTIPASVTNIGSSAFSTCTMLTRIAVDVGNQSYASVEGILFNKSLSTLIQCPGGKNGAVTIPSSVTSIGTSAFSNCTSLTSVTIPASVTNIGLLAYERCWNLTNISVDNASNAYASVDGILFNKSLSTLIQCPGGKTGAVTIPGSVTIIEMYAFNGCNNLTSITIPDSVSSIRELAFAYCRGLTSISLPDNIKAIKDFAFMGCSSLRSITIPGGPTTGTGILRYCQDLKAVYFLSSPPVLGYDPFLSTPATIYRLASVASWEFYYTFHGRVLLPSNLESPRARVSLPFPPEDSIP